MPSHRTFTIKPFKELIKKELGDSTNPTKRTAEEELTQAVRNFDYRIR